MTNPSESVAIGQESPSIQTHLTILQDVIQRMAGNSSSCKTWCVTLVSAILITVADKGEPRHVWIALLPTVLFAILDAYYLALERGFRASYNQFVRRLHRGCLTDSDLFAVTPHGQMSWHQLGALGSLSVWGFYAGLGVLIAVTKHVAIG